MTLFDPFWPSQGAFPCRPKGVNWGVPPFWALLRGGTLEHPFGPTGNIIVYPFWCQKKGGIFGFSPCGGGTLFFKTPPSKIRDSLHWPKTLRYALFHTPYIRPRANLERKARFHMVHYCPFWTFGPYLRRMTPLCHELGRRPVLLRGYSLLPAFL